MENISKQLDKMKKSFDAVALSAGKAEKAVASFTRSAKGFKLPKEGFDFSKLDALVNVLSRAGTAITNAATKGFSFGQSMANLSAITGITGDELSKLEENARRVGADSGMGVQAAAQAYTTLASQVDVSRIGIEGLNNLQAKSVTLAQATGTSLDTAASTLAGTINQFGLSAEEADRVINVLAAGSKFGAANVGELSQSFSAIGTTASTMGVSIESTAGALEVLSKANLKGSEAGTALREIMQALNTELGIDLGETSLSTALQALQPQLENTTLLSNLFGEGNLATAQYLIQNSEAIGQMTEMLTGSNVAQEQAAIQTQTTAQKLAEFHAWMDNIKVSITDSLGNFAAFGMVLAENAAAIGGFFKVGQYCLPMLAQMSTGLKKLASSTIAQTIATNAVNAATKIAAVATRAWAVVQATLNGILAANPIGLIVTAIGLLVVGIRECYQRFEGFRNLCDKVWETLKNLGNGIAEVWGKMKAFFGMGEDAKISVQTDNAFETQTRRDTEALGEKKEAVLDLTQQLQNLNNARSGVNTLNTGGVTTPSVSLPASGNITDLEQQLQKLQTAQQDASQAALTAMQPEIEAWEKKLGLVETTTRAIGQEPVPVDVTKPRSDRRSVESHSAERGEKQEEVPTQAVDTYAEALEEARKKQENLREGMGAMSEMFGSLGEMIGGAAGQWLQYGASVITAIAKAIPAILTMLGIQTAEEQQSHRNASANAVEAGSKAMKAHAGIPFVGIAMGIAAVAAIIATMTSIPKFETGGIISGSSFYGDKLLARVNSGEMILNQGQQARLFGMVNGAARPGEMNRKVVFKIEGRQLRGVLEKVNDRSGRS